LKGIYAGHITTEKISGEEGRMVSRFGGKKSSPQGPEPSLKN